MDETAVDWWARGIAGAALLVSIASLAWTVFHGVWRDRARLAIETNLHVLGLVGHTMTCVGVTAANRGRRPITVAWCSIDIGSKKRLSYTARLALKDPLLGPVVDDTHKMPKRLDEGESHTWYFPESMLAAAAVENAPMLMKRAVIRDGTGHEWRKGMPKGIRDYFRPNEEQVAANITDGQQAQ